MRSGRFRIDDPLDVTYSEAQQHDPELLLDRSETPIAPAQREDDPPELNEDTGTRVSASLPEIVPVRVITGTDVDYRARTFHGYTVVCIAQEPKQLAAASDHRTRITLVNSGGSGTLTVNLGDSASQARSDGYPLINGADIVIEATNEIWGCVRSSEVDDYVVVGVLPEYSWSRK